jgi:hypothetical protein
VLLLLLLLLLTLSRLDATLGTASDDCLVCVCVYVCVMQVWDRSARHMLDIVEIAFRYSPGTF